MSLDFSIWHNQGNFTLDASFKARSGVTAIFGKSGSGKTTIVNAIAGLLKPHTATISLGGTIFNNASTFLPPNKRRVGYVFQDARLFPHLTVAQNLDYALQFGAKPKDRSWIVEILDISNLLGRRPNTLSGGEKQRVALGRALLSDPLLLLMDEPLAALDAPRKTEILPFLDRLKTESKLPILYVSHSVDEVARLADHMVLLTEGRVAQQGPIFEVMADPAAIPILGVREAGAVLNATVTKHDSDGLSTLRLAAGSLQLMGVRAPIGAKIRLRVLAQDVLLSLHQPEGLSAQNILRATVTSIRSGDGPGAAIALDAAGETILARVTARAVISLNLTIGKSLFAIIKATSVSQAAISSGTVSIKRNKSFI